VVASMRNGSSRAAICAGAGTCFTTISNNASDSRVDHQSSASHQPERPA
jgi:hypothetical protein